MRRTATLVVVGAMAAMGYAGRARACDPAGPTIHTIDPAMVGVDQTPPILGKPMLVEIEHFDGSDGCIAGGSCGDLATALVAASASDDTTAPHRMGYRLTVLTGTGFTAPGFAVRANYDGSVSLYLNNQDIDFTLQMVAVDAAGNESAPQTVRIAEDTGICSIGRGQHAGVPTLAIVAFILAAAALRRPRRARRRALGALVAVAAFAAVVAPGRARACSLAGTPPHTIDPAMAGVDQTPPLLPMPVVREIYRHDEGGCDGTSSCGDLTIVNLTNLATDDMTPIDKIGYRLTLISGTGFTPPDGTFDAPLDGTAFPLYLNDVDDIDFTLRIVAVDAAGNESAPQTVRVHDDTGLCSVGRGKGGGISTLAVAAVVLAVGALRRRRPLRR